MIGGPDAGRRTALRPGSWSIGRTGADVVIDDPTVSKLHARIDVATDGVVALADQRSLNGSWVNSEPIVAPTTVDRDAVLRLGASQLQVSDPADGDRPMVPEPGRRFATGGTLPFNRPPRAHTVVGHTSPSTLPDAPVDAPSTSAVGIISVIAPLVFGLVMVKVFHSWLYGMFALLSPVMLVGNAIESKRRGRKTEAQGPDSATPGEHRAVPRPSWPSSRRPSARRGSSSCPRHPRSCDGPPHRAPACGSDVRATTTSCCSGPVSERCPGTRRSRALAGLWPTRCARPSPTPPSWRPRRWRSTWRPGASSGIFGPRPAALATGPLARGPDGHAARPGGPAGGGPDRW